MTRRRGVLAALAVLATLLLSGCTLVSTLAAPAAPPTTGAPDVTWSGDDTPPPPPPDTTDEVDDTFPPYVESLPVPVELGVPAAIEGRAGNQVGTITFDDVRPGFEACEKTDFEGPENGQIMQITFTVTADAALAAEDDSWDYPRRFKVFLANIREPDGSLVFDSLGFDCMGINTWIGDIEPGETKTGSIYLDTEVLDAYLVTWDYGHQRFTLDRT